MLVANLNILLLANTAVTDAGLEHLWGLPKLQSLNLAGTKVTAACVAKLQNVVPQCKIDLSRKVQAELEKMQKQTTSPQAADLGRRAAERVNKPKHST